TARADTGDAGDTRLVLLSPDGERHVATIGHARPTVLDPLVHIPNPVLYAAGEALDKTAELMELTVYSVVRLLQGRLSLDTIGGPLRVFEATAEASREGPLNYLSLMAFISINLGLINLLP